MKVGKTERRGERACLIAPLPSPQVVNRNQRIPLKAAHMQTKV
jgi:hypothetical protein